MSYWAGRDDKWEMYKWVTELRSHMTGAIAHISYPHLKLVRRYKKMPIIYDEGRPCTTAAFSMDDVLQCVEEGVPVLYFPAAICPEGGMFDEGPRSKYDERG